jgi:hypothetical protein
MLSERAWHALKNHDYSRCNYERGRVNLVRNQLICLDNFLIGWPNYHINKLAETFTYSRRDWAKRSKGMSCFCNTWVVVCTTLLKIVKRHGVTPSFKSRSGYIEQRSHSLLQQLTILTAATRLKVVARQLNNYQRNDWLIMWDNNDVSEPRPSVAYCLSPAECERGSGVDDNVG